MNDQLKYVYSTLQKQNIELIATAPNEIEKRIWGILKDSISFIKILGGIESRIAIFSIGDTSTYYMISFSTELDKNMFWSQIKERAVKLTSDLGKFDFFPAMWLENRKKIALISLAKPEVYTFPRFALGISYIAHSLRVQNRSDVYLYDLQLRNDSEIIEEIVASNWDLIGISMTFGLFDVMTELIMSIKEKLPNIKIVIGGSLAAIDYREILRLFPDVIISLGEGEDTWPSLVNWINGENVLKDIPNIAYFENDIVVTKRFLPKHNQTLPEFDLLLETYYKKGVFQIETSRGCYNACSFCPRLHKGKWKAVIEPDKLDYLLQIYVDYLRLHGFSVTNHVIYVVDEEFVGNDCHSNRVRVLEISRIIHKYQLLFEISFRMNNVFSCNDDVDTQLEKINFLKGLKENGLNRVLVGVESGVDSILKRFNKNVIGNENSTGIRILTILGIPVRFTYITFDPFMTFEELINTYSYQGRIDLIMEDKSDIDPLKVINIIKHPEKFMEYKSNKQLYFFIPYMLVSLEALIGSKYSLMLDESQLLDGKTVTSLGKRNALYQDRRIGIISYFSQLWIDNCFALDYTLKSLGKIYSVQKSLLIRSIRGIIKQQSYSLLGKMILLFSNDVDIPRNQYEEIQYLPQATVDMEFSDNSTTSNIYMYSLLKHQKDLLIEELNKQLDNMSHILEQDDYDFFMQQYHIWINNNDWELINHD